MIERRIEAILRGESKGGLGRFLRAGLLPFGILYGGLMSLRRRAYEAGFLKPTRLDRPVVCIGNLVVGGTGKTPLIRSLLEGLFAAGESPLYVTRGYGARAASGSHDDETESLIRDFPALEVAVGKDRVESVRAFFGRGGDATLIVLDDGFQTLRVARECDVVLVDARDPFGPGWPLPAGTLREFPAALRRADLVVLSHSDGLSKPALDALLLRLKKLAPASPTVCARHRPLWLLPGKEPVSRLKGRRVYLLSGIARPERFRELALREGAVVVGERKYRDHHAFTREEFSTDVQEAVAKGAEWMLATGKDEPKLRSFVSSGIALRFLEVTMHFEDEDLRQLLSVVRRKTGRGGS